MSDAEFEERAKCWVRDKYGVFKDRVSFSGAGVNPKAVAMVLDNAIQEFLVEIGCLDVAIINQQVTLEFGPVVRVERCGEFDFDPYYSDGE